jgi:tRNA-specific adenosine deaminase 1
MVNFSTRDIDPATPKSKADLIAEVVLRQYEKLPSKRKPAVRDNGRHEWVPLSGIVADCGDGRLQCLALA